MNLPEAYVAHVSMGRMRLRIPERRHDADFFASLAEILATRSEIASAVANPATASVLIQHYCPRERLFSVFDDTALFTLRGAWPREGGGFPNLEKDAARLAVPVLLGLTALQALRGSLLGPATSVLSLALAVAATSRLRDRDDG